MYLAPRPLVAIPTMTISAWGKKEQNAGRGQRSSPYASELLAIVSAVHASSGFYGVGLGPTKKVM